MNSVDRFKYLRKQLKRKIGAGAMTPEMDRHLSRAASIQLVLETSRHEMMLGRKIDSTSLAALREELPMALMRAAAASSHQYPST
jgi:hypothetical protein